jgi:hypothetical protein
VPDRLRSDHQRIDLITGAASAALIDGAKAEDLEKSFRVLRYLEL